MTALRTESAELSWCPVTRRRSAVVATVLAVLALSVPEVNAQGDVRLDASFGGDGKVTTRLGGDDDYPAALIIQPDGKVVLVGSAFGQGDDLADLALVRYEASGVPDTTFGANGTVRTQVSGDFDRASAVALQPDGKIVVAGTTNGFGPFGDLMLARYHPSGGLDPEFTAVPFPVPQLGGIVTTDLGAHESAQALAIRPDGRILVAGVTTSGPGVADFVLAQYTARGPRDQSFGTNGVVVIDFAGREDTAHAIVLQADGKVVVAGTSRDLSGPAAQSGIALARLNIDGTLDPTFLGGRVVTEIDSGDVSAAAAVLQPDGRIVVVGSALVGDNEDFLVVRYEPYGDRDFTFGEDGLVTVDFASDADGAAAVVIQPHGRIIASGFATVDVQSDFALVRLMPDGTLDPAFNGSGKVTTDVASGLDQARSMALQSDGKVVVGGAAGVQGEPDFGLARYLVDTTPHTLRFFLHGADIPGTAGSFTMNDTPAPPQPLALNLLNAPSWSGTLLTGTFAPGATFQLLRPCTLGLGVGVAYRLEKTDASGSSAELLGQTVHAAGLCVSAELIAIVVPTPVTFRNERLRLTIGSTLGLTTSLQLGPGTYLDATNFVGIP